MKIYFDNVLVPEDNEFNKTAAYYYLDYVLSTEYTPNNLAKYLLLAKQL